MKTKVIPALRSHKLYYQDGASDKVYNIWMNHDPVSDTWTVDASWGRRLGRLSSAQKYRGTQEWDAIKIYDKLLHEKLTKGYKINGAATIEIPTSVYDKPKKKVIPVQEQCKIAIGINRLVESL